MARSIETDAAQRGPECLHHRSRRRRDRVLGKLYDYDIIVLDLQLPDMSGLQEVLKARASS